MKKIVASLVFLLLSQMLLAQRKATLSGFIKEAKTGEALIGATISIVGKSLGTVTNAYGFYSLTVQEGSYNFVVSYIGFEKQDVAINLSENVEKTILLEASKKRSLREIKITATNNKIRNHTESVDMGKIDIPMEQLKRVPTIAGESDVIKVLQLTPGVKRGGEGTVGMYVRGGGADENLILLDEATVYNAGHLLGFFSVFNSNSLKDVTLYKSAFPAKYGGRLSSVLDIKMKEGNMTKYQTEGNLGLISSNLTLQGPIKKNAASFIISGRRTYIDKIFQWTNRYLPYYFYDLNAKVNAKINSRNRMYVSGYFGDDVLNFSQKGNDTSSNQSKTIDLQTNSRLGNATATLRWNHSFKNPKLFSNTSLIYTRFRYNIDGNFLGNEVLVKSSIQDVGLKYDVNYEANPMNSYSFGAMLTGHQFRPNIISTTGSISQQLKLKKGTNIRNAEFGFYANNERALNSKMKALFGLRQSGSLVDGKTYIRLEPRLGLKYQLRKNSSIKAGYALMNQYVHLVSSSAVALPTDLWYPVTKQLKPTQSHQGSLGYFHTIEKRNLLLSVEAYYKTMKNILEYREGAVLLLNNNFEKELVTGKGESYGIEFFAQKSLGRLTGWLGYTLSWANRQFSALNEGKKYFAKYDRRHDFSAVASFDITKHISISSAFVLSTGNPFTARVSQYIMPNPSFTNIDILPVYSSKNSIRLSTSHRFDIDVVFKNLFGKKWQNEIHVGAYNAYNRTQPNRVVLTNDGNGGYYYEQRGIFGFIPSFALNFKL
jgi:hypothetical protein